MTVAPEVSIGLPVADEPITFVRRAVSSVLGQTHRDWELIIVCDHAPVRTVDVLRRIQDPRIALVVSSQRRGLAASLNDIARRARGTFLARMDSDDAMFPERIATQTTVMKTRPQVDVLGSRAVIISSDDQILGVTKSTTAHQSKDTILATNPFVHPTTFARTQWWRDHPYDESYARSQDRALWLAAFDSSTYDVLDIPLLFYRVSTALDPQKYSRTASFERRAMRHFGPACIGRRRTAGLVVRSYAKQMFVTVAPRIGMQTQVLKRRYDPIDQAYAKELQSMFSQSAEPSPYETWTR